MTGISMFISINGDLGSGKSTVAKLLADAYGMPYVSTGELQREIAAGMNITTLELNLRAETDPSIDKFIDEKVKAIPTSRASAIVDSRMAWMFIPQSLKVRLTAHPAIAVKRIKNAEGRVSENYNTVEDALRQISDRRASERRRFINTYSVDIENLDYYDLVVQTDFATPAAVADSIRQYALNPTAALGKVNARLNPRGVFPTQSVRMLDRESSRGISGEPISVLHVEDDYYVLDGHNRLAAALQESATFVDAHVVAQKADTVIGRVTAERFVSEEQTRSMIYDWEAAFEFKFDHMPPHITA